MATTEQTNNGSSSPCTDEEPTWTYPTRFCRICREDVPPTVTMYPPGVPMQFQRPIVEYKNEDEYGRLIKPCMCKGSSRYIHELCLRRARTENRRAGSLWKCHTCGHQFNFSRLIINRFLSSWVSAGILAALAMAFIVFLLGFIADPILNIYMDPYHTIAGEESLWEEIVIETARSGKSSPFTDWGMHFMKGFVSMGVVGFFKAVFMNPFHYVNMRFGGTTSSTTRSTTGRDRAMNISWITIAIGIATAFVFFYKWTQAIIQRSLQRVGNHIVDTQLPGDDDDLKPPPGWRYQQSTVKKSADGGAAATSAAPSEQGTFPENEQTDGIGPAIREVVGEPATTAPITSEESSTVEQPVLSEAVPLPMSPLEGPQSEMLPLLDPPVDADEAASAEYGSNSRRDLSSDRSSTPAMNGSWISVPGPSAEENENVLSSVHRPGWSFSNL